MAEYNLTGVPDVDFVQRAEQNKQLKAYEELKAEEEKKKKAQADQQRKAKEQAKKDKQLEASYVNPLQPIKNVLGGGKGNEMAEQAMGLVTPLAQLAIPEQNKRAARTLAGAAAKLIEGPVELATQVGLNLTTNLGKNPWDPDFKRARADLGVGPKSDIGIAASNILALFLGAKAARNLPGGKLGTSPMPAGLKGAAKLGAKAKRVALEDLAPGAVADFFLTTTKDGNVSESIKNLVPEEYQDAWVLGLSSDKYGDPILNRFKSMAEGGPLNAVGNAVIPALKAGRNLAQSLLGKGATKEEALRAGIEESVKITDELGKTIAKSDVKVEAEWSKVNQEEMGKLLEEENTIYGKLEGMDPEDDQAKELTRQLVDIQGRQQELDNIIQETADPNVKYKQWETTATVKTDPINDVAANQVNLEDGFPGVGKIGVHGQAGRTLTDPAIRSIGIKDTGAEDMLKKYEKDVDVAEIARRSGKTVDEVLKNATRIYSDFQDSIKSYDDQVIDEGQEKLIQRVLGEVGDVYRSSKTGYEFASNETLIAAKAIVADLSNDLYLLAKEAEDADVKQLYGANTFDRSVDRLVGVLEMYKTGTQEYGGGLSSLRLSLSKNTFAGEAEMTAREFEADDAITSRRLRKWATDVKDAYRRGDPEAVDKMRALIRSMVLAGGDPSKTVNFAATAMRMFVKTQTSNFYNSILSGTKTLIRNASNAYRLVEAPLSMAIVGAWKGDPAIIKAAFAGYSAIGQSTSEAFRVAARTWKVGIPAKASPYRVLQDSESLAMLQAMEMTAKTNAEKMTVGFLKAQYRFAEYTSYPSKMLMSMDDAFKTVFARQRIAEMATYKAMTEAKTPTDVADYLKKYTDEYSKYIDPQTGVIKEKGLQEYADVGTFQNNPGEKFNNLTRSIEGLPYLGPLGKQIVPFIRTPANIFAYQLEHLPLTNRFSKQYQDAMASEDPLRIAEYEGRQAIGVMTIAAIAPLTFAGLVTGNYPLDPKERQRWKMLGIKARSFVVNGQYVSYNALEPLSNIIAATADITQLTKLGAVDAAERLTGTLGLAFAASFTEKSYFSGLQALGDFLSPETWTDKTVMRGLLSAANNNIGLAGIRRALANSMNPYMREFSNEYERTAMAAIPGYALTRPIQIDVLTGKPLGSRGNLGLDLVNSVWNANVPFEVSPENKDPVAKFLMDVEFAWKDTLEKAPNGQPLLAEQKAFIRKAMFDNGLRKELDDFRKLQWVKDDLENWKNRDLGKMSDVVQVRPRSADAVQQIWDSAKQRAFAQLEMNAELGFGQASQDIRKTKYQTEQGNYNPSKPQDFSTTDTTGSRKVYDEIINFGNPK